MKTLAYTITAPAELPDTPAHFKVTELAVTDWGNREDTFKPDQLPSAARHWFQSSYCNLDLIARAESELLPDGGTESIYALWYEEDQAWSMWFTVDGHIFNAAQFEIEFTAAPGREGISGYPAAMEV